MIKTIIYGKDKISKISSVEDWLQYAPPKKGLKQWENYRSAKEHARFMVSNLPFLPIQLEEIISKYTASSSCICYGEFVTDFNNYNCGIGEGRNHDSLLVFDDLIVRIEAKAEESLGKLCKKMDFTTENKMARYNGVSKLIYGDEIMNHPTIRYQMLSASLGTLIEAEKQNKKKALLLIITYNSKKLHQSNVSRNDYDIDNFVKSISNNNLLQTVFGNEKGIEFYVEKLKIEL